MKQKELSRIEEDTLFLSVKYAAKALSLNCVQLPFLIVKEYYKILSEEQKGTLKDIIDEAKPHSINWRKLSASLGPLEEVLIDGTYYPCFIVDGIYCPVEKYIKFPDKDFYVPKHKLNK